MSEQNPAPGWYPAPHANNEQRYWDGAQWTEPTVAAPTSPGAPTALAAKPARGLAIAALIVGIVAFLMGLLPVIGALVGLGAIALGIIALLKKQPKGFAVTGLALGAVALITSIAVTAGLGLATISDSAPRPAPIATSEPSETPSAAPTEEAAPEPTEEPVEEPAAPLVPRQDFTGTGDMVLDVNVTEAAIISFSCGGCTRNTVVKTNGRESLIVNTIGAYSGSHLINLEVGSITTQIIIESTGNWALTVDDVTTAASVDNAASGVGDSVVIFRGSFDAAAITNDGASNFVVRGYGENIYSPLIVNTIGAYSGTVQLAGPAVVQVLSTGNWSITGQ